MGLHLVDYKKLEDIEGLLNELLEEQRKTNKLLDIDHANVEAEE